MFRSSLFAFLLLTCSYCAISQDSLRVPFKGIGIQYRPDSVRKLFVITRVLAGNAGAEAGLREGDLLVAINQQPLWTMTEANRTAALRGGEKGEPFVLTIEREVLTSLGKKQQSKEIPITPRLVETQACLSGDCKNGEGKFIDNLSGEVKEGRFVNGELASGKIYYRSGRIRVEGSFVNKLLEGPNCTTYYDQAVTSRTAVHRRGKFIAGILREGNLFSVDGTTWLTGSFDEKGLPHGKNFMVRKPNFSYEGDMEHGEMTGEAKSMTYQEGTYEGPVVKGKPEGKGTWYFSGRKHKGKFVNGLMEGQFQVTEKTGSGKYHHVYQYRNGVQL